MCFSKPSRNVRNDLVDLYPTDSCGVGMITSITGQPGRCILDIGLTSLANVAHRGAIAADGITGDGAGVTTTLPEKLIQRWMKELEITAQPSQVGVGVVFLPNDEQIAAELLEMVCRQIKSFGLGVLGVRQVPTNTAKLGDVAAANCPTVKQIFISAPHADGDRFERELFLARRASELTPQRSGWESLHIPSMSCRTISYKAMVLSASLADFYPDLKNPEYECTTCIFHQRFSTNTQPTWSLCQPFRMLAHNGEINTIRGNRNWFTARESNFFHPQWHRHRDIVKRLFRFDDSDSASLDNALELLTLSGRSIIHAISMLIPPDWRNQDHAEFGLDADAAQQIRAFYEYHSCFSEPWDGPAAIAATDGKFAVACLDKNGLRPARYKITDDDILIVGSELGSERIDESTVIAKGRLAPGEMIAVDLQAGQLLRNIDICKQLASQQDWKTWVDDNKIQFRLQPALENHSSTELSSETLMRLQIAAGFTREEIDIGLQQMAESGKEPTFSMGVDTPLAVFSKRERHIADYFKQRFAQVTNPPIDPIREQSAMSVTTGLGPERNILDETPQHARVMVLDNPVLAPGELDQLLQQCPFQSQSIDCTWHREAGRDGLEQALKQISDQARMAVEDHASVLILTDRHVDSEQVAIPMLLAVGAVHHALIQSGQRMMCSIIAETAEVRDPHQLSLLFGYGCTAVYPYLAFDTILQLKQNDKLSDLSGETLIQNYRASLKNGLCKIMSKMGISVLKSYQGAQVFEAIGIGPEIIDTCFRHSLSVLGGIGFAHVADDCLARHHRAFQTDSDQLQIADLGILKPRRDGEQHLINGKVTKSFHQFVREGKADDYFKYQEHVTPESPSAIRDVLQLVPETSGPIPIDQVEPIESIRARFTTAAMSLGAISPEAHEALAIAMNEIGGKSNSGEGGEERRRFTPLENGRNANSRIKQIASGRFGVDAEYLNNAVELEIKMAQGAKPGEGGQLPGFKVDGLIAKLRNTDPGVTLISPPPHHDIYSIEDLAQLIFDLKMVNPRARVCVKLVAITGVGGIAVGAAKAQADSILISGHDGGTGASPLTSIKHAGIPWEVGLAETQQALLASAVREQIVLRVDGGLRTGRDIVHAAILGAEEFNFGTMALVALGCVYVKKCHLNNCPVGIATQDPKFRARYKGKPENLINYLNAVAAECREILAELGVSSMDGLIGQTRFLKQDTNRPDAKSNSVSLAPLLRMPAENLAQHRPTAEKYRQPPRQLDSFDDRYLEQLSAAVEHLQSHEQPAVVAAVHHTSGELSPSAVHEQAVVSTQPLTLNFEIFNTDRNIGTRAAGLIAKQFGKDAFAEPVLNLNLHGSAGQSLGAFLCSGIVIELVGEANDYVGKGMSGGEIVIRPADDAKFRSHQAVIAGNTLLYGATGGRLFAAGLVAERFCVRNSGAIAVVEGCGEHGCEYMTRGTAVVLGAVGKNFAAGMTGGRAYIYDPHDRLENRCNQQTVEITPLDGEDRERVNQLISEFQEKTMSSLASQLLEDWDDVQMAFKKVSPRS